MEIKYLGHASFLINTKAASVVIDPFDPKMVGFPFPKVSAEIVLVTHPHRDHDNVAAVGGPASGRAGSPFVISGPGEYEVRGIKIDGLSSYHDDKNGAERGRNTVYLIRAEGLSLLHCGDLGHPLPEAQLEHLGEIHILLVPVGGFYTLGPENAAGLVAQVEPKIVIPMHYRTERHSAGFTKVAPLQNFLKEMGGPPRYEKTLKVKRESLPEETQVVVLGS